MNIQSIIRHRVNATKELANIDPSLGVEIDLRTYNQSIVLNHEPYETGDDFEDYLSNYKHSTCIVNTKEDGLEDKVIGLMEKNGVEDYFFLDTTVPTTIKYVRKNFRKIAVRFSEYEPLEFVKQLEGKVDWVWVDCFTKNILTASAYDYLKRHFKICIVSPELQSHSIDIIKEFKADFKGFDLDAVCTKRPDLWK